MQPDSHSRAPERKGTSVICLALTHSTPVLVMLIQGDGKEERVVNLDGNLDS